MNIVLVAPKVAQNYISRFPEAYHNAYDYFNYDNRVVNERVDREDHPSMYMGPDDFTNDDYDSLIKFATAIMDERLMKYSVRVACEDALSRAIWSFPNGQFQGKVNASRFEVLVSSMMLPNRFAAKKQKREQKREKKKPQEVKFHTLRQLGLEKKKVPFEGQLPPSKRKGPRIVRQKGKVVIEKNS